MSKTILTTLFIALFLLVLVPSLAKAETTNSSDTSSVGWLPDHPLYFLKNWGETVKSWLIFKKEAKLQYEVERANRRIAEFQQLCEEKNKCDKAEKMAEKYQKRMEKATQLLEKLKEKWDNQNINYNFNFNYNFNYNFNKNVNKNEDLNENENENVNENENENVNKEKGQGKDVEALVEKLTENHLRQQEVLQGVYENAPDSAKDAILKAMENSSKGLENAIQRVQGLQKSEEYKNKLKNEAENWGQEIKGKLQFLKNTNTQTNTNQ